MCNRNSAKEIKQQVTAAEKVKEIVVEEKLHITEIEETIEAEIPLPVEELTSVPKVDGKFPRKEKSFFLSTFSL